MYYELETIPQEQPKIQLAAVGRCPHLVDTLVNIRGARNDENNHLHQVPSKD